jgi:signal transduction histidine kinase
MALENGLRNAVEATAGHHDDTGLPSVVVTWGTTDRDFYVSVLDRGVGLPGGVHRVFDIGSTTKRGHLGMGLALAKQAVRTLGGRVALRPRKDGGVGYEFRWPRPRGNPQ